MRSSQQREVDELKFVGGSVNFPDPIIATLLVASQYYPYVYLFRFINENNIILDLKIEIVFILFSREIIVHINICEKIDI